MEGWGYLMTLIISRQFSIVTQGSAGWRLDPCLVSWGLWLVSQINCLHSYLFTMVLLPTEGGFCFLRGTSTPKRSVNIFSRYWALLQRDSLAVAKFNFLPLKVRRWLKKLFDSVSPEIDMIGPRMESLLILNSVAFSSLVAESWLDSVWVIILTLLVAIGPGHHSERKEFIFSSQWVYRPCNWCALHFKLEMWYLTDLLFSFKSGAFCIVSLVTLGCKSLCLAAFSLNNSAQLSEAAARTTSCFTWWQSLCKVVLSFPITSKCKIKNDDSKFPFVLLLRAAKGLSQQM